MNLNFIASNKFDLKDLTRIETFVETYPGFQGVVLNNEDELRLLLELWGITELQCIELNNAAFVKYWDLSHAKFPEFDEQQFDRFYEDWIKRSNRENSMDEYGSLIFLKGLSSEWNRLKYRLIVQEN